MRRSRFFAFITLAVLAVALFLLLDGCSASETKGDANQSSFGVIDEAYDIIKKKGVYSVDEDLLIEGALRGMTDVIGDPYSTYFSKDEAAAHKESLASERIGIGAEITRSNGKFIIVAPVKSSPAEKAGLRPYDEIVRIDGERLEGDSLKNVVQRIRGKKGTTVKMTIFRPDDEKHIELNVVRDTISVKTVFPKIIKERKDKIGYISITTFGEESAKEWKVATDKLIKEGAEALIIDVRGNPGGYLHTVGDIAGSLVQVDSIFAYMQDAKGMLTPLVTEESTEIPYDEKLKKMPIVLMQDKGSASASEVLSGALKDLKRAYITGTTSFGKGTVQDTIDLSNGGEVKLSTHKWLTPKEQWIHGKGINPDLAVEQNLLFTEHIRISTGSYKLGDFDEDIAYAQRLLMGMGYSLSRKDGYLDESTVDAVQSFRSAAKVNVDQLMDREFFVTLKEEVEKFRADQENDDQLQMAVGYIHQKMKSK